MRDLADDYYDYDEKNYCIRGRRRGNVYRLGDPVRVRVANANLERKQLDFILVGQGTSRPGEDDLGSTVTVRQALANTAAKKAARAIPHTLDDTPAKGKRITRAEKAKAAARASRAKKAAAHKGSASRKSSSSRKAKETPKSRYRNSKR